MKTDPTPEPLSVEPPGEGNLQYMAWAAAEDRALSGWLNSRSDAESIGRDYGSRFPDRPWTVLWRGRPAEKMTPKHPKG